MATYNVVWQCEEASANSLSHQATFVAMVTLASCEHCSISCNPWWSDWGKVNALREETEALVCKLRTAEGRQKIVVFCSVVI